MAIDIKNLNHKQLEELISRAEARKNELGKEKHAVARQKVLALAKAEGFTIEELFDAPKSPKPRAPAEQKYRNPEDPSETWSGRGRTPLWISRHLAKGKKKDDFLIM